MAILHEESHESLDLETGAIVLTYTHSDTSPRYACCRVFFGDADDPIVGNGQYELQITINDVRLAPDSLVQVPNGAVQALAQSRDILLAEDDVLVVTLLGVTGDDDVSTLAQLVDVTPLTESDVFGEGTVAVDHDYGGTDALRVTDPGGAGIQDVAITAYLASDYDAGFRSSAYVRGRSTTNVHGRWRQPISLDPESYKLVVSKPSEFATSVTSLTVS